MWESYGHTLKNLVTVEECGDANHKKNTRPNQSTIKIQHHKPCHKKITFGKRADANIPFAARHVHSCKSTQVDKFPFVQLNDSVFQLIELNDCVGCATDASCAVLPWRSEFIAGSLTLIVGLCGGRRIHILNGAWA